MRAPIRMERAEAGAGAVLAGTAGFAYPPRASTAPQGGAPRRPPACITRGLPMNGFTGYAAIVDLANRGGELPDTSRE